MNKVYRRVTIASISWIAFVEPAWGCPNCGDALSEAGMARGFLASLAVLLILPAVLFGGWGWVFWKQAKRYKEEDNCPTSNPSSPTLDVERNR